MNNITNNEEDEQLHKKSSGLLSRIFSFRKKKSDSFPLIFEFFQIKEIKDDLVALTNGSLHAVLDVRPIPYNKSTIKKLPIIIDAYKKFLDNLDFNIKLCVRTVNDNLDTKLKLLKERTIFKLKKEEKFHQVRAFSDFMDWLEEFSLTNCKVVKKRYIVVSAQTDDKKMTYDQLKIRLSSKINYIIKGLKLVGISEIIRLNSTNLENLYNSYLSVSFYINDDYALPEDIIRLYKLKRVQQKIPSKKQKSKKLIAKIEEIKDYIKHNRAVYEDDLEKFYHGLDPKEVKEVEAVLTTDENVGIFDDIYKYIPSGTTKSTEGTLLDSFLITKSLQESSNHIKIGNTYVRNFTATAYPEEVPKNQFLQNIFNETNHIDITLDIDVEAKHNVLSYYIRKSQEVELELNELHEKGYENEELNEKLQSIIKKIASLKKIKIFKLALYFLTESANLDSLNTIDHKLHTLTRANKLFIKPVINYQTSTLKTICPLDATFLTRTRREIVTASDLLSNAFPFFDIKK